jgi:replicative DNA helicase
MDNVKVPPQAIDIEQKVLGAMLQSSAAVDAVLEILRPEDFYRQVHSDIFEVMMELVNRSEPVDTVTVANDLKKKKKLDMAGGEVYLMELVESAVTPANVEYHAGIVKEKASLRLLINVSTNIITRCFDEGDRVESLLDEAESKIFEVSQGRVKQKMEKVGDLLPKTFEDIESYGKGQILGIPSGFKDLDEMTAGFQGGDLIILAGRPSMGKTGLALAMGASAAIHAGKAIGVFSLEMSRGQLVQRLLCSQAKINMHQLRTGRLPTRDFPKLSLGAGPLYEARIFIDDSSDIDVVQMRSKARRLKAQDQLDMLIVDYMQLIKPTYRTNSREQEIAHISRSLKGLAKDLNIPIMALSQLSRRVEERTERRPQLSDLRESGAIEQDADVVLFIYREEVYNPTAEPGKGEIIIGKQRNGPIGSVNVTFIREYAGFENYSPRAEEVAF